MTKFWQTCLPKVSISGGNQKQICAHAVEGSHYNGIHYIMSGSAFVVANEIFHHIIEMVIVSHCENDYVMQHLFQSKFNYSNKDLYSEKNFNHLKLRYINPCKFLTKAGLVSQPNRFVVIKESNNSHYLNLSIHSPTIILPIIQCTANMTIFYK